MRKVTKIVAGIASVLARSLLCAVFFAAVLGYTAPNVSNVAQTVAAKAAVAPAWVWLGAMALLVVGCLSVIAGYKARFGALALLAFLGLTTYLSHGFSLWSMINNQARQEHIVCIVTNLSIMGAMLFVVVNGAGQMSLDSKRR